MLVGGMQPSVREPPSSNIPIAKEKNPSGNELANGRTTMRTFSSGVIPPLPDGTRYERIGSGSTTQPRSHGSVSSGVSGGGS